MMYVFSAAGREWMNVVDTPNGAGDGSKVMDAYNRGHYYVPAQGNACE